MGQGATETPGLSALRRTDPTFDESGFMERAVTIIDAARDAEQNGQWDMVRPYMSVRFFRRWQPWAQGFRATGVAKPSTLIRQLATASAQSEAGYDRVTVRVDEQRSIPATQPPVSTLWTFLRSATGRTGQQTESFAAICTNCGAPVDATNQQPAATAVRASPPSGLNGFLTM